MDSVSELTQQQLPILIKEWRSLEVEMDALSAEIREKRKRVKLVREMITKIMKGHGVGQINISAGAVTARSIKSKAPMTKKYILGALMEFFKGDKAMAEKCAAFLDEHRPLKTTDKLELDPVASTPGK